VALNLGRNVLISQHIGDMETPQARDAFEGVIGDLLRMCEAEPVAVAHDLHPDYPSTGWARESVAEGGSLSGLPLIAVQHHHAHLASCLAENRVEGPALGVTWDGTGYGADGSVWGGEFLLGDAGAFERVAHLRPFRLPGGDAAVKAPRRVAVALLWELYGEAMWERRDLPAVAGISEADARLFTRMLAKGVNSPVTTSAGRLFDAVAALADLRQEISYEGQAAMQLEFVSDPQERGAYPLEIVDSAERVVHQPVTEDAPIPASGCLVIDWRPLVAEVLADWSAGRGADIIGARFHNALVETIVQVADRVGESCVGESRVALSGGCFQNRRLTEGCIRRLRRAGHEVLVHRRVPANDGGISLGQVAVASTRLGD
jgi:hydrogenase maturation protein HypF